MNKGCNINCSTEKDNKMYYFILPDFLMESYDIHFPIFQFLT